MKVSSTYLCHINSFSDVDSYAISSKYSIYALTNSEDNSNPKASSSFLYQLDPILKQVCFHTESQHLHQIIYWNTGVFF